MLSRLATRTSRRSRGSRGGWGSHSWKLQLLSKLGEAPLGDRLRSGVTGYGGAGPYYCLRKA